MVLNSLAGAMLDKSFECLAEGGIFLEIGKRGLWTHERVAALGRGIRYHIVDCNDNARDTPEIVGQIFTRVLREIESGELQDLPITTFAFDEAPDAFRYMAQAKHIGRVVFRHRVEPRRLEQPVREDAAYLVTGGLRGLGLLAAQWLVGEGARHLVLAGRSEPDATALEAIAAMRAAGATVSAVSADVATAEGVSRMMAALEGTPVLGGVIHCAGILDDGVLAKQGTARFAKVMGPKADGAWRLHAAMRTLGHRPDFFVLYSSLSAVFGSAGQGNYVAANAFLDALAHRRRVDDLPALSVNWGAWSEVGMATRGNTMSRAGSQGIAPLSPVEGMQALGLLMREGSVQASASPIDWATLSGQLGTRVPPLLSDLVAEEKGRGERGASQAAEARVDLTKVPARERRGQLVSLVQREVAKVLGLTGAAAQSIPTGQPFTSLGMDSLTSVELRNRLQNLIGRPVAATAVFEWPSIVEMAGHLDTLFAGEGGSAEESAEDDREKLTL
jgi:NADP-dependent 3-hydroxy acid dehydrogenase YdfG